MLTKKIAAIFLTVFMLFSLTGISASAATTTQDGLEVTLTTDKTEYTKNEQITATLKVENTSSETISNVTLETAVPDGYKLADDFVKTKKTDALNANESVELPVTYVPTSTSSDVVSSDSEKNTDNNKNGTGSSQIDNKTINNVSSNVSSGTSSGSTSSPKTGIISDYFIWIVLFVIAGIIIAAMVVLKKKTSKGVLSFFLCISIIGAITAGSVESVSAAEIQTKTISISENLKVNDFYLTINAIVKYNQTTQNTINSDNESNSDVISQVQEFYGDEATVVDVINVSQSKTIPNESEVISILKSRGFVDYPITFNYSLDGEYVGDTEVTNGSTEKYPMYQTYYRSSNGELWTIFVINGQVMANPATFNIEYSEYNSQLLISEYDYLTSYDDSTNLFYVTKPKESSVILKTIERIDANLLDKLTSEEIKKL